MTNIKPFKLKINNYKELTVFKEIASQHNMGIIKKYDNFYPIYIFYEGIHLWFTTLWVLYDGFKLPETNLHEFYYEYSGQDIST